MIELATDDDLLDSLLRFADLRRHRARLQTPRRFPASLKRATPAWLEPASNLGAHRVPAATATQPAGVQP
jgi:hypothetical protein